MTNREKYKTEEARSEAFYKFCDKHGYCGNGCILWSNVKCGEVHCMILWLDLEAEEEKPMNCPFCGNKCVVTQDLIKCLYKHCAYTSGDYDHTASENIAAHNRICKTVAAFKESEAK